MFESEDSNETLGETGLKTLGKFKVDFDSENKQDRKNRFIAEKPRFSTGHRNLNKNADYSDALEFKGDVQVPC